MRPADFVDVDWTDGDLKACSQAQEKPACVKLPYLGGGHHQSPPNEQGHDREGQEAGLPTHSVHQVDGAEGTK